MQYLLLPYLGMFSFKLGACFTGMKYEVPAAAKQEGTWTHNVA